MNESLENKIINAAHLIEPSSEFSERLWEEIKHTPLQTPAPRRAPNWRWLPITAVIVLAVILIVVSPQAVLASLRSLFDFLPGIGLVQNDASTLYLAEPIVVEQDGLTMTIEQIVADANKIVISYHIDNLPTTGTPSCCYNENQLLLPDGTALLPIGSEVTCERTYSKAHVEFMPLPEGVTKATLLVSLQYPEAACTALPAWQVAFSLGPTKPADIEFLPVVDEPTETNGSNSPEAIAETAAEATQSDVRFIVDHSVTLEDGYLLYGHIEYADAHWIGVGLNGTSLFGTDATGKAVPLKLSTESILDNEFVIEVAAKDFAVPLTLQVQSLWISAKYENLAAFSFDAGVDPQVGQIWDLNQEIDLAGNKITILSIQVIQEPPDPAQDAPNKGYGIEINTATEYFTGQIICDGQGEATAAWGQSRSIHGTNLLFETYYADGLPYGLVSCGFQHAQYMSPGFWEFNWQPPDPTE